MRPPQVFSLFEDRMARMDKQFADVLDGMHAPKLKMADSANAFVLTVALDPEEPIDPKELEISIEGSTLIISSQHHEVTKFSETTSSQQMRLAAIPLGVDTERAESEFNAKTQTLTVTLPKLSKQQTKKMRLKVMGS